MNTKIDNPHAGAPKDCCIQANIDPPVHTYLFRQVFAGDRGVRSALVATFIQAFSDACQAAGIPPTWEQESYEKARAVLARLNFDEKPIPFIDITANKPVRKSRPKQ